MSPSVVHLIDAPIWVFRAWHSLPPMQAPDGTPTSAAYGFTNTLIKFLAEQAPSHVATCFDHDPVESFRSEIFPDYKAQRGRPPEELSVQFGICMEAARALGVAVFELERYEADDLIATLARRALSRGAAVRVWTSDKDLAQLVREDGRLTLHDFARGSATDADGVRARFGVAPEAIPDYLGLVGDASDNLPGVPGVGPRTAAAALRAFGRIEDIPADPDAWAGLGIRGAARAASLVQQHRELALRTRSLATVVRDVPGVGAGLAELRWGGARRERVEPLFARLSWNRILDRVPSWA